MHRAHNLVDKSRASGAQAFPMQTLLVSLSAFAAGALVGVVLLSCWLRAIQSRLLIDRRLDDSPKVRTTILNAAAAHWRPGR